MERDFSKELESFRKAAIRYGIITEGQASAVQFMLLGKDEVQKVVLTIHGGIAPDKIHQCQCSLCKESNEFFAIAIDGSRISEIQSKMLVELYGAGLASPLEMNDCGVSQEKKESIQ